jgi:hypothetical protein
MSELDDLRQQRYALTERINEIEQAERQRDLSALVGRSFRYRNCYSCPESEAERWWMYTRITGVHEGTLQGLRFQTDKNGKAEIEACDVWGLSTLGDEIDAATFNDALAIFRAYVAELAKETP